MNEKGTSAIELVLVLPILLSILFGIIEYGWVMKTQTELNNAVSEGARAVVKEEDAENPSYVAMAAMYEVLGPSFGVLAKIRTHTKVTPYADPSRVKVAITNWPYKPLTGFLPSAVLPSALSAKAVMAFP